MINRNSIVKVLEPGAIKLHDIKLSVPLKYLLYSLHDAAPECTLTDLHLYIDVPQTTTVTQFRKLQKAGYIQEDGLYALVSNKAQAPVSRPSPKDDPERQRCLEMAEFLAPIIAQAYRMTEYNKYALSGTLYKILKDPTCKVNLEVLDRATKWIALHVNDPQFPVIHRPFLLFNKWGYIVNYKKRLEAKHTGKAYL